ncbi:MAG: hypothetical protein MI892_02720 [Desulfobacterales bacterium]|nr:hypothetical protein [Desulfobacterales bacterium]
MKQADLMPTFGTGFLQEKAMYQSLMEDGVQTGGIQNGQSQTSPEESQMDELGVFSQHDRILTEQCSSQTDPGYFAAKENIEVATSISNEIEKTTILLGYALYRLDSFDNEDLSNQPSPEIPPIK